MAESVGVAVLVGDRDTVEFAWRRRVEREAAHTEIVTGSDAETTALRCIERIVAHVRAATASATDADLVAEWRSHAAAHGEDDPLRLGIALFHDAPGDVRGALRAAFDDDSEQAAIRALRAAVALLPGRCAWLLVAEQRRAIPHLIWLIEELAAPGFTLAVDPADWAWLRRFSRRAAARCAAEVIGAEVDSLEGLRQRARHTLQAAIDDPSRIGPAMSAAEAFLFAVLERRPSTAGRFVLDGRPGFKFGAGPCRVDLLAQRERIALEIDGPHHFADHDAYRRDRRKDLLLQEHGFAVIRVLALDVVDRLETILETVDSTLAWRAPR